MIVSISHSDTIFVGSPFNLTCAVNLPQTVDIPVTVSIMWNHPTETVLIAAGPAIMENLVHYTSMAEFMSTIDLDNSEYRCTAKVNETLPLITSSKNSVGTKKFKIGKT